jgi:hypothetical protein
MTWPTRETVPNAAGAAVHAPQCFGTVLLADRRPNRGRVGDFAHREDEGKRVCKQSSNERIADALYRVTDDVTRCPSPFYSSLHPLGERQTNVVCQRHYHSVN